MGRQVIRPISLLVSILVLAGCTTFEGVGCPAGFNRSLNSEMFFGRNSAGVEIVSDADWQRSLDEEVAPRFPGGFTVVDARGQWRGDGGTIERERAKIIRLVLKLSDNESSRVGAIRSAYKTRFHQESVLLTSSPTCASF